MAKRPKRRLFNFLITDAAMADGLKAIKERDGISESEQVRRAVAAWLTAKGVALKSKREVRSSKKRSRK
jgi:hypothetical protein